MSIAIDTEVTVNVDKESFDEECVIRRDIDGDINTDMDCGVSVVCNSTCDDTT